MSELDKQKTGEIYDPADADIQELQLACLEKMYDYNATRPKEFEKRQRIMKEMLAEVGEGCYIEPPLHANFGGHYLHFGHHVYANFNLTLVDDTDIYIGNNVMLAPNVVLTTTGHPVLPRCASTACSSACRFTSVMAAGSAQASWSCRA